MYYQLISNIDEKNKAEKFCAFYKKFIAYWTLSRFSKNSLFQK